MKVICPCLIIIFIGDMMISLSALKMKWRQSKDVLKGRSPDKDLFDEEDLKALQERINRLKKIQVILNDRGLDDFKEIIYPVAKSVPALALLGAGGLCLVIGPVFACLFAVAFLSSNLYLKGKSSTLNIHFGIAAAIQTTAIVLAALTVSGVVMFNPALISGLVAVGGAWLFCTAVLRGGERQKEARDVKLAAIEKNMHAFYQQLRLTKKKIKTWSIIPTSQVKKLCRNGSDNLPNSYCRIRLILAENY